MEREVSSAGRSKTGLCLGVRARLDLGVAWQLQSLSVCVGGSRVGGVDHVRVWAVC